MTRTLDHELGTTATTGPDFAPPSPPSLWTAATWPIFGSLWWLRWVWLAVTAACALTIGALTLVGSADLDQSLWQSIGTGWQRFLLAAAGFSVATTFTKMFVTNGLTRRRLAQSAIVAMIALAVLSAAWLTAGFAVERPVFALNGWTHAFSNDRTVGAVGLATIALVVGLVHAAYFAGGWILGLGYQSAGWLGLLLTAPLSLIPVMTSEMLVAAPTIGSAVDALDEPFTRITSAGLPLGAPVVVVVTAASCALASRWNRTIEVE